MEAGVIFDTITNGVSGVGTLLLLILAWKSGLLGALLSKGEGNGKIEVLQDQIQSLTDNHAVHIEEGIKDIKDGLKDFRETQLKQCTYLTSMDESLKEITRNGVRIKS